MFNKNSVSIILIILFLPSAIGLGYKNYIQHIEHDTKASTSAPYTKYVETIDKNNPSNEDDDIDDDINERIYNETSKVLGPTLLFTSAILAISIFSGLYDDE